ncbi:histidine kinase [Spirosoma sp.]|uniref:sensor histidine kinase n=1 Tax=Spirosoma sp. TaxID=1899569 RepID=UPI003B3B6131
MKVQVLKRYFFITQYVVLVSLFVFTIPSTPCFARLPDFNVQLLDESNGIQTSYITKLIKDQQGFLWLLSPRYVQRFDGQNVKRIDIQGEDLLDIVVDRTGTIWVSSQSGIKRFVSDRRGFESVEVENPSKTKFDRLQVTPDNKVWLMGGAGLFLYDRLKKVFSQYSIPALKNEAFYRRVLHREGSRLFFSNMHALFAFDVPTQTVRRIPFESTNAISSLSPDTLWVTNSRLQTFEIVVSTGAITPVSGIELYSKAFSGFIENDKIIPLDGQNFLVTTYRGCYKYDRAQHRFTRAIFYHAGNEIPNDEIYTDCYDADGTLWILCQQGILFFRPNEPTIGWLRNYMATEKGWNNNIQAITEDNDGNIWLGTVAGFSRLNLADGHIKAYYPHPETLFRMPSVQSLTYDGKKLIIIPLTGSPLVFDPASETFSKPIFPDGQTGDLLRKKLEHDNLYMVYPLANGNHLILADQSCYLLEKQTYRIHELTFTGANYIAQTAMEDARHNVWIGTYKGLLYVRNDLRKTLYSDPFFAQNNTVTSILAKNDSTIWVGTVGLYEITRTAQGFRKKALSSELSNQRVSILHRDVTGKIWMAADNGLYRYDEKTGNTEWFDVWDNVQNKRLHANSLLASRNGVVYLGGFNGLNYFIPARIKPKKDKLNVLITGIQINQGDSIYASLPLPLSLDWKQNSIEIQYVTTYYHNPQKVKYRYRLAGLDTGWVYNGRNNRVRFSSLDPGDYSFTVAASLDGVTWFETKQPFVFIIASPFWKQSWFILLCVLLLAGLIYWLMRLRDARIKRQIALKQQVAEIEMKALRAQMNPHFIFNCLNSINRYIVKSDNATASLYLTRFAKLIRLILDNSNSSRVLLSNELEALKLYMEMEALRFDNKFSSQLTVADNVYTDSIEVPSLIIQPYVENAIWHGLLHKESNGHLSIRISMEDETMLHCEVEDNGIGRQKASEFKSKSATNKKSLGMKLTEDRIQVLNQYASLNASVDIIDLHNANNEPAGTKVIIKIPV